MSVDDEAIREIQQLWRAHQAAAATCSRVSREFDAAIKARDAAERAAKVAEGQLLARIRGEL